MKVSEAVAGEPEVTVAVPCETPSSRKVTVPLGGVESVVEGLTLAVTWSELPAVGVVVDGMMLRVVVVLATVMATPVEADV
ncbi:MAG TPA: hypothetical protein VM537_20675, partial [Anaerolineae bacterium]|nr:hypothetical protein [Anaerolineae bacterium]